MDIYYGARSEPLLNECAICRLTNPDYRSTMMAVKVKKISIAAIV